nr:putative late blight resistance protein homolog R1B-17 [Ipomoea batatas]GMD56309.1 putative late blight resistance protein homolog R1B-17 [Ipomoea batatas]
MAGIGKTTLARSVYGDPQVASRFVVRGWVTMPQEFEESQLLWDLLGSITQEEERDKVEKGRLLRVMAFVPSSFLQREPMHLSYLVFLRYLSVTQWFEGLDCIVSTNLNLQTLVVSGNESQLGAPTIHLPCEIWDLPLLRHLELGNMYALDPPFQMKKRENLQELSWASPTLYKKETYRNFPLLRKLKVFYRGGCCSNNSPLILDGIDYLKKLEKLTISVLVGCTITFPEQCMFPLTLKKLGLSGTNLCSRDLSVISMLPQLEVLKLENAIHGNIWEVDKGGFNKSAPWLTGQIITGDGGKTANAF